MSEELRVVTFLQYGYDGENWGDEIVVSTREHLLLLKQIPVGAGFYRLFDRFLVGERLTEPKFNQTLHVLIGLRPINTVN